MGDFLEVEGLLAEGFEGAEGLCGEAFGFLPRLFEAEDGGVGGLVDGGVLAGGFTELLGGLGDVEDVVDDLEGEAEVVAEIGEGLKFVRGGVGGHASEAHRAGEECGSLRFVDADEVALGELLAFAFEVEDLASDEPATVAGLGEFGDVVLRLVA